ncbi:uncharacterized protein [Arachis hypogaea]|uniref:uncharacterized protein n=1 Tax=Arachis hypogaea TaxID=3818 RepID=UPI003B21A5E2
MNMKFDALQSSITQLLHTLRCSNSPSRELSHGASSIGDQPFCAGLQPQRVNFDLSKLDGSDALGWIFSMDQYFDFFWVSDEEQVGLAALQISGPAIPWELHFKLQQQASVGEYYSKFVALANRTQLEPPDALRGCFISGLRSDIRREVKAKCPPSLMRAVNLARLYENKFNPNPLHSSGPASHRPQFATHASSTAPRPNTRSSLPSLLPTPPQLPHVISNRNATRRLTPAEIQSRRKNGLCYWFDERFLATHKCTNHQFMSLQLEMEDDTEPHVNMDEVLCDGEAVPQLEQQVLGHHLSYNAMHDTSSLAMIRIKAHVNSSDSFIQPRITKFLNLPIEPAPRIKVMVGDFDVLEVEGYIPALEVNLCGCTVTIPDVFVLHIAGGDLEIGTTWLKTLKAHIVDYDSSFLRFLHNGQFVTQLFAKLSKCLFGTSDVDYLGHTISGNGVHMERAKVEAVTEWKPPQNLKQLRGFLGLTGYYRRFIKGYATIAAPLTDLLKKEAFEWSHRTDLAFNQLKHAISSKLVLALPNFALPFEVETNASGSGIGAILAQGKHPIAYFSKKLSPSMQQQSAYTREFYAITEAIAKFRHYLLGKKFVICTDQSA